MLSNLAAAVPEIYELPAAATMVATDLCYENLSASEQHIVTPSTASAQDSLKTSYTAYANKLLETNQGAYIEKSPCVIRNDRIYIPKKYASVIDDDFPKAEDDSIPVTSVSISAAFVFRNHRSPNS